METWLQIVLAVLASSGLWTGLWTYLQNRRDKKDAKTKMILGLGHDRLVFLCMHYIDRGWISSDEYEDLIKYLYTPYIAMKGNGTVEKLMNEVKKLPIHHISYIQQAHQNSQQNGGIP
jgi:hypothetical protein